MKQWISFLLAVTLLFTCIPMNAMAANGDTAGSILSLEQPAVTPENTTEGISLTWDPIEDAAIYQVYRSTSDGSPELLGEVTECVYLDDTAEDGVTYTYCVVARNGDVLSSSEQSAQILRLAKTKVSVLNVYGGITVKWTEVEGAESYRLYRKVPGGSWEVLATGLTDLSYTDAEVQYTSVYEYAVQSCNATGGSAYATGKQIIRIEQPTSKGSNVAEGIKITWNEVAAAECYNVYRKAPGGSWVLLSTETETSYVDTTVESGVKYSYRVLAKNGSILSSNKHSFSFLRMGQPTVKLLNIAEGISVKWDAVAGADTYRVYRQNADGTWKLLKSGLTDFAYTDTSVEYGQTYFYSVRTYNNGYMSSHHLTKNIIRIEQPTLTLSNAENGITASWNAVTAAESYNIYRKGADGTWKLLANVTETSYVDETAEDGETYSYRVLSKNGSVLSSNKRSVKIQRLGEPEVTVLNVYGGISVKWTEAEGAKTYTLYRKAPGGQWETLKTGLTSLSHTDGTVQFASEYVYAVRAFNTTGGGAYASSEQIIRIEQPEATVTNKTAGVQITWYLVDGAECYNVYRKASGGSWKRLTTETDATTYVDTTAKSGVTYTYRVKSQTGDTLSSNKHSVTITYLSRPKVTASNVNRGVVVRWNAVEAAESYRVMRKVSGGSWETIAEGITELQYTDTAAVSGTTYQYTVRTYAKGCLSSYYATKDVHYLSRPDVTATTVSTTSIKLQWKAVPGAEEYIIYVKNAEDEWEVYNTVTGTTYTAKGLTFGETYTFGVRAVNDLGQSTRSAEDSAKATYPAPQYDVELKPGKGIEITWKAVEGAKSYRVYRRVPGGTWKTLKTTTSTSYVDTSGQAGTTYEYGVRAFELEKAEGIYGIRATGKTAVYSTIDPSKPMVALTFDDGPSAYTKDILNQLEKYNAHATFFVVGNRVASNASTIKRAYDLGCEIGNHSWSHPQLSAISVKEMQNEISKTDEAVKKITGQAPTLLRPPYGAVDADVKAYAGKPLIHWSIDTLDWEHRTSSKTISSVLNNVRDGSIVLMHDIYAPTRDAAVSLIPTLISRGYQLVTVSEMAAYRGVDLKNGTIYYSIR